MHSCDANMICILLYVYLELNFSFSLLVHYKMLMAVIFLSDFVLVWEESVSQSKAVEPEDKLVRTREAIHHKWRNEFLYKLQISGLKQEKVSIATTRIQQWYDYCTLKSRELNTETSHYYIIFIPILINCKNFRWSKNDDQ